MQKKGNYIYQSFIPAHCDDWFQKKMTKELWHELVLTLFPFYWIIEPDYQTPDSFDKYAGEWGYLFWNSWMSNICPSLLQAILPKKFYESHKNGYR